jgi:RNA polymerase sigma-32 factor
LNATQSTDEEGREWIETLEDESEAADSLFEQAHDNAHLRKCLLDALSTLNERERLIVRERAIREDTRTLESLGKELSLSKERIRQIEAAAFQKLRKHLQNNMAEVAHYL